LKIGVVLPCYKSKDHVLDVISRIGEEVSEIFAVDDACPEKTGQYIVSLCVDPRVRVLFHQINQGVGGATITGYKAALDSGCDVVVKVDSDGQMDPALINNLVRPIRIGIADYVKGNRFFDPESVKLMPRGRLIGNLSLSFLTKLSSGYWRIFDPTNGFTACHRTALKRLPLQKLSRRYFFETDMLFRLNIIGAAVSDMPMSAVYGNEKSNLSITKTLMEFPFAHFKVFSKRVAYQYFLRDFSMASVSLACGLPLVIFGVFYGLIQWVSSILSGTPATSGSVMLSALPVIIGFQMLLAFLAIDAESEPRVSLQRLIGNE